ncbi:chloride channel protein [Phototrophicus methaneseepsis]|uniref:Chloride channel protein n=1 Tax=Phototrophicus methaneseepsis TaxID=2710758 RepID=A0A7S8IG47_9CHLR|nr:chloride channel protein [Phototrophicus methaneseepsis]QPC84316.1 chloride channel protein [Phototrophicus methaneseepsis]
MIHYPRTLLNRLPVSENSTLLALAVVVGLATGVSVTLFRSAIDWFHEVFVVELGQNHIGVWLSSIGANPSLSIIPILMLVGLVVGWISYRFIGHERHHGVAGIIESVALTGGRLPFFKAPAKVFAAVLSLAAGASVGPEDPSVQIGANLGSFFGQKLNFGEEYINLLVAAGAASAIASAFNAPIAGVFFALEIVLREFTSRTFGIVVLSAVISAGFTRSVRGANPIFDGLEFILGNPLQLVFYLLLGVLLAGVSVVAIRFFYWQKRTWDKALNVPIPVKTALTGLVIGIVGIFLPQIMGAGEEVMHDVLTGHFHDGIALLLLLGVVKWVMTATSIGGHFVGGVFAPVLFVGIFLGDAYGEVVRLFLPESVVGAPQTYAIAGMAGLLAGIVRAPITAIMLVFEITDDYALILPMMLTAGICVILLERTSVRGIYMTSLAQGGLYLKQGRDIDLMQAVTVQEAMRQPAPTVPVHADLRELRDAFHEQQTRALCVINDNQELYGIVTLGDLQRAFEKALVDPDNAAKTVGDIATQEIITARPEEALWSAIRKMGVHEIGRLPVVDSHNGAVVGLLRRHDIMNAYNVAASRKLREQHIAEQVRLQTLTGAHVVEYRIRADSSLSEKQIKDIEWPPESVIASIQRKGRLIVPHGSTVLKPNDTLTIVADEHSELLLDRMFESRPMVEV